VVDSITGRVGRLNVNIISKMPAIVRCHPITTEKGLSRSHCGERKMIVRLCKGMLVMAAIRMRIRARLLRTAPEADASGP